MRVGGYVGQGHTRTRGRLIPFVSEDFPLRRRRAWREKARKDPKASDALASLVPRLETLSGGEWTPPSWRRSCAPTPRRAW